jgi:hypothetical protein
VSLRLCRSLRSIPIFTVANSTRRPRHGAGTRLATSATCTSSHATQDAEDAPNGGDETPPTEPTGPTAAASETDVVPESEPAPPRNEEASL